MGRVIEGFKAADVIVLLQNQARQTLEESTRIAGTHHEGVLFAKVNTHHVLQAQERAREPPRSVAGNQD